MYQLVLLWEAALGFREFSWRPFVHFMMGDLRAHLPTVRWVFSSFWPKTARPLCPTLHVHLFSPPVPFLLVFPDEKSPQREMFCQCGRGETKDVRSTKRHQNWWIQTLFGAVGKTSPQVYRLKWRVLWRQLKFKHMRINEQVFINKFWVFWGSPLYTYFSKTFKNSWKNHILIKVLTKLLLVQTNSTFHF